MPALEITQLRLGDKGEQVKKLQSKLKPLGLYVGKIDGHYGRITQNAVRAFQTKYNLTVNGIVDDPTWKEIFEYVSEEPVVSLKERWNNFNTKEIVNPLFDHCPVRKWEELPTDIQINLSHTMDLAQAVRTFIDKPMRINSSWRPHSNGSAHQTGKAVDLQFLNPKNEYFIQIMNWLKDECPITGFRAFLEWKGNMPWLHLDRNFDDDGGKKLYVAYKEKGKMKYRPYEGKMPQEY